MDQSHPSLNTSCPVFSDPAFSLQVEGQQWKTQRKIIATCFNEQNHEIVWSESLSLARDMLAYWSRQPSVTTSAEDLRTLSLHVLSGGWLWKVLQVRGPHGKV